MEDEPIEGDKTGVAPESVRRFGDDEIREVLGRAIDLQERSVAKTAPGSRGLTLQELRQVAEEVGIDPHFVDQAVSADVARISEGRSGLAGGPYSWHYRASLKGEIGDDDRERILHAIRSTMGQKGELADVYGRMEWSYDDGSGPVIIGISTRDGKTEVDVSAVKTGEVGILHGLGISFGGIFGGAAIAGVWGLGGAAVLPVLAGTAALSYAGLRLVWKYRSRWWARRLEKLVNRVSSIVQDVAVSATGGGGDG